MFSRPKALRLFSLVALVAMLARVAVPSGFMLVAEPDRWVTVTLCSGTGPMGVLLNLTTGEQRSDGEPVPDAPAQGTHHPPCLFSATASLAAPPVPLPAALPAAEADAPLRPFPAGVAVGRGLAAPPPWATGPPLTL